MRKLFLIILCTLPFIIYFSSFGLVIQNIINPELQLIGEWNEVAWEFEKVNKDATNKAVEYANATEYVKRVTGQHLVIHEAEKWEFTPNGELVLMGNDYTKKVSWYIKGRGNVLQLKYDDGTTEFYNISQLDDTTMILHFDSDIHIRGIAKLTLEKNNG